MSETPSTNEVRELCIAAIVVTCGTREEGAEEFDAWLADVKREAKAEALREFARNLDLDVIASEWALSDDPGVADTMHWAAGNAAATVHNMLCDSANHIEKWGTDE